MQNLTMKAFEYYINLDERGEFFADVRDSNGETIYEIHGFDLFEERYMLDKYDVENLADYLADLGILPAGSAITLGN